MGGSSAGAKSACFVSRLGLLPSLFCVSFLERPFGQPAPGGHTTEGRNRNVKTFINLLKNDSGASAAEYALILALVGTGIALAAYRLGGAIRGEMNEASSCIATTANTAPSC